MELKTTVKAKQWWTAKAQLQWSMVRLQVLASFLGVEVGAWKAWVCFKVDRLSGEKTSDPMTLHRAIGSAGPTSGTETARAEWAAEQLSGLLGDARLSRLQLDPDGAGELRL